MSLETEIARLADVLEKGFANLATAIRQSEIPPLVIASPALGPSEPAKLENPSAPVAEPAATRGRKSAAPPAPAPEPAPATVAPAPTSALTPFGSALKSSLAVPNGQARGPTFDEVVAIAQELARQKTPPVAIKLINAHGAQKLADMDPANYPAFYAAAQVELGQTDAL